ncbi:hypothetical protein ACIBCA_09505 [Kitasatospora sp. NPDC051170]
METLRTAWFGHPLGTRTWWDPALLTAWTAGSALLTRRLFRWEPRHG